ncbi:TetR/AcrR family transcriptional regulator [Nisaea sediminum]|uniref:TetR/AcrR family transcriptional regulator n=1 Tax=Nisaea sediminum TaxID=2775867 RepID=UPI001867FADF|nr:TetR/AcrR family transcriptional regulator [Nisaea sediminum]
MKDRDRRERRNEILDAAIEILIERGYRETTMLAVAKRANASKETLYSWFGDKTGLFEAVIQRNAERLQQEIAPFLSGEGGVGAFLTDFGIGLLNLLLSESGLAINRAAISEASRDLSLSRALERSGRGATFPLVIDTLRRYEAEGALKMDNPVDAGEMFLGLLTRDLQVRALLGLQTSLDPSEIRRRAEQATGAFLRVYGTDPVTS